MVLLFSLHKFHLIQTDPRVIRECYQMLGEDSHGKAEDMFNMMDKWAPHKDCSHSI